MTSVSPALVTSLTPPLVLLPAAVFVVAARLRTPGAVRRREDGLAVMTRQMLIMVGIAVLTGLGVVVALALSAAGWGLLWAVALCMVGCGAGWKVGSSAAGPAAG
ncbi:hypothetical protein ACFUTY_19590 [Streptomyces sp. NPDC057362]|uniref:hypothetical protein n=1 Tax=Streptomyces sp. NPDC057362 TaxID=3346106 RepID=UPI0036269DBA